MKTKSLVYVYVALMFLIGNKLVAQVSYGVSAGVGCSTQSEMGQLWNNSKLCPAFFIGGFAEYVVGDLLSYRIELNYQEKGEDHFVYQEGNETRVHREFDYISIPFLLNLTPRERFGDENNWGINGFAGPYFGYLLSAHSGTNVGDITTISDIESNVEKSDIGLVFGGGVFRELENGNQINLGLRYEMGLKQIDTEDADLRNKMVGFNLAYKF